MKLSIDKTPAIVSEFMQAHIVSKAPAGWQQFGLGFLSSYVEGGVKQMLARNAAFLTTFGIVDDKGIVDMDKAYTAAVQQLERSGGKVMFNGIIFGRSDLDALLEISRKYGA